MTELETCATLDAQHINILIRNKIVLSRRQDFQNAGKSSVNPLHQKQ